MGLYITHSARIYIGLSQRPTNQLSVSIGVGHPIAIGFSTVIDGAGTDNGMNIIAIGFGLRKALQQYGAHALSGYETISTGTKALTFTIWRQHHIATQTDIITGVQIKIDPSSQSQLAVTTQYIFTGLVNCRQ